MFAAQVVACGSGHLGVAWLSSPSADPDGARTRWRLVWSRSDDGGHSFRQITSSQVLHTGGIQPLGNAPQNTLGLALAGDGRPLVAVARDTGASYELVVARGADATRLRC